MEDKVFDSLRVRVTTLGNSYEAEQAEAIELAKKIVALIVKARPSQYLAHLALDAARAALMEIPIYVPLGEAVCEDT